MTELKHEISRWGVGPSIAATAGACAVVAGLAGRMWPELCLIAAVPRAALLVAGSALLVVGAVMLAVAARAATVAYNSDRLAATGIFAVVRNPIYAAWIVFLIPGGALLTRSWPMFLAPVAAYLAFKACIGRENECLERRFGDAYRKYRAEVPELFPLPRFRKRTTP